jgi:hypothetical protein
LEVCLVGRKINRLAGQGGKEQSQCERMWLFPTKQQYQGWSLPSKLQFIGFWIGVLSLILTVWVLIWPPSSGQSVNVATKGNSSPGAIQNGSNNTLYQAGRDLIIHQDLAEPQRPPKASQDLAAEIHVLALSEGRHMSPIFFLVNRSYRYPVHIAMMIRLKNLRSEQVTIENYWIETETRHGWMRVNEIPFSWAPKLFGAKRPLTNTCEYIINMHFNLAIRASPIDAKSWIPFEAPGWVFFEAPKFPVSITNRWRMHIELVDGTKYVQELKQGPDRMELGYQIGEYQDISSTKQMYYFEN